MGTKTSKFSIGDWVVHLKYGIGRIRTIERKRIGGTKDKYYKVNTEESVYWIPCETIDFRYIRPIASSVEFKNAIKTLHTPPEEIGNSVQERQLRIKEARADGSLKSICTLVRDLWQRRNLNTLNPNEKEIMSFFKRILVKEWCARDGRF